jgi:putative sterol carrier protein
MKVLALNSSPRAGRNSKTGIMLKSLTDGMAAAGAGVESVDLRDKKIKNCAGCFNCWTRTPGVCIHQDDMTRELFPRWLAADVVIYASPLYHFTVNASMKCFIERTLPVLEPFFEQQDGRTYHPLRHQHPKVVLLSVAGFPDDTVFDQLSSWVNFIYGGDHPNGGVLIAEVYRPMAEALTIPFFKDQAARILNATYRAGQEIVEGMRITEETMALVRQPMLENPADFLEVTNTMWQTCIDDGISPKEFGDGDRVPRPDSIPSYVAQMKLAFNSQAAENLEARVQFNFSGETAGGCFLDISRGAIQAQEGKTSNPNLTVNTPFEVWMDILSGKADGQQLFIDQKYTVEGDLELLMQMDQLFGVHN